MGASGFGSSVSKEVGAGGSSGRKALRVAASTCALRPGSSGLGGAGARRGITFSALPIRQKAWWGGRLNIGTPFVHIINHIRDVLPAPERARAEKWFLVLSVLAAIMCLALAVWQVIRARNELTLSFLGFSLMPFFMTDVVWIEPWSYGRVLLPVPVFLILNFIRTKNKLHLVPMTVHAAMFFIILSWMDVI